MTIPTFVVFEGKVDGVTNPAGAYDDEATARQDYDEQIKQGHVNRNVGLFLGRLDNVEESDINRVYDNTSELADEDFEGLGLVVLDSYASDIEDWADESLVVTNEEFDNGDDDYQVR
jgi:hypothetical protein